MPQDIDFKLLRGSRSLRLDLVLGAMEVELLGATWSPCEEGPPQYAANAAGETEKYAEGAKHLWYNLRP